MQTSLLNTLPFALVLSIAAAPLLAQETEQPGIYLTNREANLYSRPSADSRIVRVLKPQTLIKVVTVSEQWYEIRSPKGNPGGFIRRSYADPYEGRARREFRKGIFVLTDPVIVRSEPDMDARQVTTLSQGTEVYVTAQLGNWYRVESESGERPPGFIPAISARRAVGE